MNAKRAKPTLNIDFQQERNGFSYSYYGCIAPTRLYKKTDEWQSIASVALQYILGEKFLSKECAVAFSEGNAHVYLGIQMDLDSYQWNEEDIKKDIAKFKSLDKHLAKFVNGNADADTLNKKWQVVLKKTKEFLKNKFKDDTSNYFYRFAQNANNDLSDAELIETCKKIIQDWLNTPKMLHINQDRRIGINTVIGGMVMFGFNHALEQDLKHNVIAHYSTKYVSIKNGKDIPPYNQLSDEQWETIYQSYSQLDGNPDYEVEYNAGGLMVSDFIDDLTKAFDLLGFNCEQIKFKNSYDKDYNGYFSARFWADVKAHMIVGGEMCNDPNEIVDPQYVLKQIKKTKKLMQAINKTVIEPEKAIAKLEKAKLRPFIIQSAMFLLNEVLTKFEFFDIGVQFAE